MTIEDIRQLIERDETKTLEMKKTTGELKDGMHSACAFLNTNGGWLLFGITPHSLRILGENVTDNTRREIAQALKGLEPRMDVDVKYIDVPNREGCQVIAMHFDGWRRGMLPYIYDGCPWWRNESTTERMPRDVYDERLRENRNHLLAWEMLPAEGMTMDDLDDGRIKQAVRISVDNGRMPPTAMAASKEEVLQKLGLIVDGKLTNAAAVLFCKENCAYPQMLLRMAQFRGTDKSAFGDNKRKSGNFFDLLDAGVEFMCDKLPVSGDINGLRREENYEVPLKAMREALVNALCHREYSLTSDSVSIAVYTDRLEINNPGKLPVGLTAETIKLPHESHPHNPLIASVLYKTTYLENWGSGVQRMVDECRDAGVPEPMYETKNDSVLVCFDRISAKNDKAESNTKSNTNDAQSNTKSNTKKRRKSNTKSNTKVMTNQQMVLNFCRETAHTAKEIFKHLRISVQVKHYDVYIRQLEAAGKLQDVTPERKRDKRYKTL